MMQFSPIYILGKITDPAQIEDPIPTLAFPKTQALGATVAKSYILTS
jgi:hypothetical protein